MLASFMARGVARRGIGGVQFAGNAAAIFRQGLGKMIRIIGEVMQDAQIASQQIERDSIVRLYSAEKLEDLLARVGLILKARVQAIKEDDGGAGRRVRALNA